MNTKSKCIFTIVAKNYLGLAIILRDSFFRHNDDTDFYIFVADENIDISYYDYILIAKDTLNINDELWYNLAFKYTLTEFCTCIKPFCFQYLFEHNYDKAIYIDPDCYFFSSIEDVYSKLNSFSVFVTPHVVTPISDIIRDVTFLQSGVYNLGFIGFSKSISSDAFIKWWGSRLLDYCYDDVLGYTFTDQKWANYITCYFDIKDVYVSRDIGLNYAPWNYFEREVLNLENTFFIKNRYNNNVILLKFAHFSGFKYKNLVNNIVERNRNTQYDMFDDSKLLIDYYKQILIDNSYLLLQFIDAKYTYNYFKSGEQIHVFQRRLYRVLYQNNYFDRSPFTDQSDSFFHLLLSKKMISKKMISNLNINDVKSSHTKIKFMLFILKIIYKIIGVNNYLILLKFFKKFSKYEAHTFLLINK